MRGGEGEEERCECGDIDKGGEKIVKGRRSVRDVGGGSRRGMGKRTHREGTNEI